MNAFQGYLEKLGGNFLVASFIPSLAFVIISIISFGPIIPERVLLRVQTLLNPLGELGVVLLLLAVIIGFTLTSLSTQVFKLFEGYVLLDKIPFLRASKLKKANELRQEKEKLVRRRERLWAQLKRLQQAGPLLETEKQKEKIKARISALNAELADKIGDYDKNYPPNDNLVMPTQLGNILKAAEAYPGLRYEMDAVSMWPRMLYAVSTANEGNSFMAKLDFSNDQCNFLLNVSLLSGIYAVLAICAALYQFLLFQFSLLHIPQLLYFIPISPNSEPYFQRAILYLVLSTFGLCCVWFFYKASLWNVSAYGSLIRSTYDMFRFELLTCLHLELPLDNSEKISDNDDPDGERVIWRKVKKLFNLGEQEGQVYFTYDHKGKSTDK